MLLFCNIVAVQITETVHRRKGCHLILNTPSPSYSVLYYGLCLTCRSTSLCTFCHKWFYSYWTT